VLELVIAGMLVFDFCIFETLNVVPVLDLC